MTTGAVSEAEPDFYTPPAAPARDRLEDGLSDEALARVLAQPWIAEILPVPDNARLPRLQSGVHPAAVGSYGAEVEATAVTMGFELRWFQRYIVRRLGEHDAEGNLVWFESLVSAPRQVGKSYFLRAFGIHRVSRADLYGGQQQLVWLASQTLDHATRAHEPARTWAAERGWPITLRSESVSLSLPKVPGSGKPGGGSMWRVGTLTNTTSNSINLLLIDEAWCADPDVYESRAKPTALEAAQPQIVFLSTAGTEGELKATPLVPAFRARVLADLEHPDPDAPALILEWSMRPEVEGVGTPEDWRDASPHWSRQRAMLIASAAKKRTPKAVRTFRAQYGNVWPKAESTQAELLISAQALVDSVTSQPPAPAEVPVLAIEDYHGNGAAVALALRQPDGSVWVTGEQFESRTAALDYAARYVERIAPEAIVLVGASMETDPQVLDFPATPELRGTRETKRDVLTYRRLVADTLVAHDEDAPDLRDQLAGAEMVLTDAGVRFSLVRHDLAQACVWAVAEAARYGVAREEP